MTRPSEPDTVRPRRRATAMVLWAWLIFSATLYLSQFSAEAKAILQILGITG